MPSLLNKLYSSIIDTRNILYNRGIFKTIQTPVTVISIGNIEVGGTGKTPFTIELARHLKKREYDLAIVTRGYKGSLKGPMLVSREHRCEEVGDEALLMAKVSGVPVVKSPDRVKGAEFARDELGVEMIILDDGFQHRRIYRDLDIVLVSRDVYTETTLPFGNLREGVSSLDRADFIVATKGSRGYKIKAKFEPTCLVDARGDIHDLSMIKGKDVLAFCAIARPEYFFDAVKGLGAIPETLSFRDHHLYSKKDLSGIRSMAKDKDYIITTEKDFVRLEGKYVDGTWLSLRVEMKVHGMDKIIKEVEAIAKTGRISRQG